MRGAAEDGARSLRPGGVAGAPRGAPLALAAALATGALLLAPAGAAGQEGAGLPAAPAGALPAWAPPAEAGAAEARAADARAADDPPPPFSVALRGGFSSPKGDLGDLGDDGQLLALALGYRVSPRVTLLVEGSLENLERGGRIRPGPSLTGVLGPDIELWRIMALASVELTDPGTGRWEVAVQVGAGPTIVSASAFANGDAFETVEPTLMAGVLTGYDLSRRVTVFVRGGGSIWFDGTGPDEEDYFGKEVTMTHTLGLRLRL